MKIVNISIDGVSPATAYPVKSKKGDAYYYCITHGENGRGRWQYRLPLAHRDFPCSDSTKPLSLLDTDVALLNLKKEDKQGNPLYLVTKSPKTSDNNFLVLLSLNPGFRGSASFQLDGNVKLIAKGYEAQGDAGRMGGAVCPVLLTYGECVITWNRRGRLYGSPSDWIAQLDSDGNWTVMENETCTLEEAVFS